MLGEFMETGWAKLNRFLIAAMVSVLLARCGGAVDATVGGSVDGLSGGTSVVLVNNGTDPITVNGNVSYQFDVRIATGAAYAVTVSSQPVGETCTVANGSGTIDQNGDAISNVIVNCFANGTAQ